MGVQELFKSVAELRSIRNEVLKALVGLLRGQEELKRDMKDVIGLGSLKRW